MFGWFKKVTPKPIKLLGEWPTIIEKAVYSSYLNRPLMELSDIKEVISNKIKFNTISIKGFYCEKEYLMFAKLKEDTYAYIRGTEYKENGQYLWDYRFKIYPSLDRALCDLEQAVIKELKLNDKCSNN